MKSEADSESRASPPPSPETSLPEGVIQIFEDGALRLALPIDVYGLEAIFRSCYWLTDRCYVYLAPPQDDIIEVTLVSKEGDTDLTDQLTWDFLNDLLDKRLQVEVNRETKTIREIIVAQAFAETELIDDRGSIVEQDGESPHSDSDHDTEEIQTWKPAS